MPNSMLNIERAGRAVFYAMIEENPERWHNLPYSEKRYYMRHAVNIVTAYMEDVEPGSRWTGDGWEHHP